MTIARAKIPDFGVGDEVTYTVANQIDENTTYALDKRAGETDTLESEVTCSGAGRIRGTYAAGANANTTYLVSGQNATIYTPTLTANRTYTLSNTDAAANDRLMIINGSNSAYSIIIKNAAAATLITLGSSITTPTADGSMPWAEFLWDGAWVLLRSGALLADTHHEGGQYNLLNGVSVASTVHSSAFFSDAARAWYLCAATEELWISLNGGLSWTQDAGLATAGAGENLRSGDSDAAGNLVVNTDGRYCFAYDRVTATWTKPDVFAVAIAAAEGECIAYDPISALWCAMIGKNAGTEQNLVRTSSDRAAWTSRTGPLGFSYGPRRIGCKKSTGVLVAVNLLAAINSVYHSKSTDGGITWADHSASPLAVGGGVTELGLAYHPTRDEWILTCGERSGTPTGKVYKSTDDGATWSLVKSFTGACIVGNPCVLDDRYVAVALTSTIVAEHLVVWSDDGVTWHLTDAGNLEGAGSPRAFGGAGRLMVVSDGFLSRGVGFDNTGLGVLT